MISLLISIGLSLASHNIAASEVTLLFAGDAMTHQGQIDAARQPDGSYSFGDCFTEVAPVIQQADYAIVNLETTLGGAPYSGYPCFCAPDSYADALRDAGFDLMLTANNHTLDRRDRGLKRTIEQLDRRKIPHIGTYMSQAARDSILPFIADVKGFKIGMLNYTYGTNGIEAHGGVVVDYINRDKIAQDIDRARQRGAEIIMVAVHWGSEYQLLPHQSQRKLADFLTAHGVDLVIGSHPHVIQPMEMRTDSISGKKSLVVYSLGNFISNMKTRDTRGGALAIAKLRRDSLGKAYIESASYRLLFTKPGVAGKSNYTLHPAERFNDPQWGGHCKAFQRSAEAIFNKHNINVKRDTTHIINKIAVLR